MGNKPSKTLYDIMDKLLPQSQSQRFDLSLLTLCEKPMSDSLKDRVITKIFKSADIQAFENDMHLNVPRDLYTDERESKKRKYREMLHQSLLVAGHERHPQMDSTLRALEESPLQRLDPALSFTNARVKDFLCLLMFLRSLNSSAQVSPSFEAKLAQCLTGEPAAGKNTAQSAGASAALSFASLLLDPKQISREPQILAQALQLFRDVPPLSLYGWTRQALAIEQSIGKIKACLLYLIENETRELMQGAILTLCYIGLACGSIENLLLGLLYAHNKHVDMAPHAVSEVIERLESLPAGMTSLAANMPELDPAAVQDRVAFEQLYLSPSKDAKGEEHSLSSCTDGEFVYVYSAVYGLVVLGAGRSRIRGKVYGTVACQQPVRLLTVNRKLYAVGKNVLYRLSPKTGQLKETRKSVCVPKAAAFCLCSTKGYIVGYAKVDPLKDKEGCFGEVAYFDPKSKSTVKKFAVEHSVGEVREIVACGDLVILIGGTHYVIIDLPHAKKLKEGACGLLEKGTICADPATGDLFAVFAESPTEGLQLAKLHAIPIQDNESDSLDLAEKTEETRRADPGKTKREVASLLGFYVPLVKEAKSVAGSREGDAAPWARMLEILVARAKRGVLAARVSTLERPEEIFGAFKAPLGVHLSGKCFDTQIDLLEFFLLNANSKASDVSASNSYLSNAISVLSLLNLHIQELQRCELSLTECAGKAVAQKCLACIQGTVKSIISQPDKAIPASADPKLRLKLICVCELLLATTSSVLLDNSATVIEKAKESLRAILAGSKPDPAAQESAVAAATWLGVQKNQQTIAGRIMERDTVALEMLDTYFAVEEKYLECKIEEFLTKHSPGLWIFEMAKNELETGIRGVIEKLLLLLFTNLKEKQWEAQDVLARSVFPLLLPRLYVSLGITPLDRNKAVSIIKTGYERFRESLVRDKTQKKVGQKYFSYWKFLEGVVWNDMLLFCSASLATTSLLGIPMLPEQSLHIAQTMLEPILTLKSLVSAVKSDKECMNVGSVRVKDPFNHLLKFYKLNNGAVAKGTSIERCFEFKGDANAVRIRTLQPADLPPPASNVISILDARTGNCLGTINRESPRFNQCVNSTNLKVAAKISSGGESKDMEYSGCKLVLRPKNSLKDLMRRLAWTACFLCKSAVAHFNAKTPGVTRSQADLMGTLVASRLFSGGMGANVMQELCSATFNKQLAQIVADSNAETEAAQIFAPISTTCDSGAVAEIYAGTHPGIETTIARIQKETRMYNSVSKGTATSDMVKSVFVLLLKINDAALDFLQVLDPGSPSAGKAKERVVSLYSQANQMRVWLMEKKQLVANTAGEEGFEKKWHELVERLYAKIRLLSRFRFASLQSEARGTRRAAKLIRTSNEQQEGLSETELVRTRLSQWKDVQISVRRNGAELSLAAAAIELLQSDIPPETVLAELEKSYLRGMTIYGAMGICGTLFASVPSTSMRIDIVAWAMSMIRREDTMGWAHSDSLRICGMGYEKMLRERFFSFISDMLDYMGKSRNPTELSCFLEALRWNYSGADHRSIRDCELFPKLTHAPALLGELWGKELDCEDRLAELLLDTFEYVVIRIALRGLAVVSEAQKTEDAAPCSPHSPASPAGKSDDSTASTVVLVQEVVNILTGELAKAANSYENSRGIDPVVANKYADTSRAVGKEDEGKSVDKKKVKALFLEGSKRIYSPDFCIRILRLLYHICVSASNDPSGKAYIRLILKQADLSVLMRLLDVGSSHQQFLVLQTIPYLVILAYPSLEAAAEKHLGPNSPRYSSSHILDVLFAFALERREGIWTKVRTTRTLGYALSKCVIRVLQGALGSRNELGDALRPLLKTVLFGDAKEVRKLPAASQSRRSLELLLSVAGGEFESLHKGAVGFTKDKKEFEVVAFASLRLDPTQDAVCEWEFQPRVHDQVLVHLVNEEGTTHQMPVFELAPIAHVPEYEDIMKGVKAEDIVKLLSLLLRRSKAVTNDTLSETLKVKLLKVLMLLLKSQKDLSRAVFSEELVVLLLGTALQYPKIDTSKSLLMAELAAEEMRKRASQADYKALRHTEGAINCVVRKGNKLLLTSPGVKFAVRVYAHLNFDRLKSGVAYEYVQYSPKLDAKMTEGKVLFVDKDYAAKVALEEIAKGCQAVVLSVGIAGLVPTLKAPAEISLIEIADTDMLCLDKIAHEVEEVAQKMATLSPEAIMADYMSMPRKKEVKANTLKGILQELVTSEERNVARKFKSQNEILGILAMQSEKRTAIFREGQDNSITEERASYSREYAVLFKQVHEQGEEGTPESYASLLHDLHVFYARHLLLRLLIRNQEKIVQMPVELYKKLLTFLLISAAEADLMKYAVQHKALSKRLNKLLLATLKRPDAVDVFIKWTHERVMDTVYRGRVFSYSISSTPQSKLEEGIYLPFVCRYMRSILRFKNEALMTSRGIDSFMDDMMGVVIVAEKAAEKFRAISLVRKIIGSAAKMLNTLPAQAVGRVLGCQSLKALAQYFNKAERKTSVIWRTANEILMKANVLFRYATALHGEWVQTYYIKNAFNLFIASEVMKEFPRLTLVSTYIWGKHVKKDLKGKETMKIVTPSPLYDTQYCVLVNDPQARSLQVSSKKASHRIALVSIDREGCAELPSIECEESKFLVEGNRFYLHFPCETYSTYALGLNDAGQLGFKDLKSSEDPRVLPELAGLQIRAIISANKHTHVISTKDAMYCTGKGEGRLGADVSVFSQYKPHQASGCIATNGPATVFYDQKAGTMFAIGRNPERMFGPEAVLLANEETIKAQDPSVTQISVSSAHMLVLYNERQLYGSPGSKKELYSNFAEGSEGGFFLIRFGEEIDKIFKVLATGCGTIILCLSRISGHRELYSFGLPGSPLLGQTDHQLSDEYGRLESVEFVDLMGNDQMAAAITSNGELYTWGCGALGLFTEEGAPLEFADRPTQVLALLGFAVLEVSVGATHILALVADPADPTRKRVFGYGDGSKGQLGKKGPDVCWSELEFFANKKPYRVCAGNGTSFVCCGEEVKGTVHRGTTCCVTGVSPIRDVVYFRKDGKEGFRCWSKECVGSLPSIVLATKNPIAGLSDKPWPNFDEIKVQSGPTAAAICGSCKSTIAKDCAVYRSAVTEALGETVCETCFFRTPTTFQAMVYYRISSVELAATELPLMSMGRLYDVASDSLIISVNSVYKYEFPRAVVAAVTKPSLAEFLEEFRAFEYKHDIDILDVLNDCFMEKDIKIESLSSKKKKTNLRKFSDEQLRLRAKALIKLNKVIRKVIDYIDFGSKTESDDDLYTYYNKVKEYILLRTKDQIAKQVLMEGPRIKGKVDCVLERSKAFSLKALGQVDSTGQRSIFGQLWQQLKGKTDRFKKRPRKIKFPFSVKFKGEGGIDAGGLFRETLDQLCDELQSSCLPLLVPTPNNKTAFGEFREKWTVNPSATQELNFEMYTFLGNLIGMSFRLGHLLPLNLSSVFWKRLAGEKVDRADLRGVDAYCVQCLDDIVNIDKKGVDSKSFSQVIDDCFVTRLSDGSEVELIKNGRNVKMTFENRTEYAGLVETARLEEGQAQIKAVVAGVFSVVPQSVIRLYTWRELEYKVCGKPSFSVDALKKITRYSGCSERDGFIQHFWQALEEFTDEERSLYLRFVWGRSRMPTYTDKYVHEVHFKRCANPDLALPIAHTCGFQLDLPNYSSVEKAKEKLRYAIRSCQSIDADRENYETWQD